VSNGSNVALVPLSASEYLEDDVSRQQVHLYDSGQQRMDEALLRLAEQRALADELNQACQSKHCGTAQIT
jgi:hypothetical protein